MDPEAILAFGQNSGIHGVMHTSWGWPIVESLHFIALTVLIGTIGVFDLRLLGVARGISVDALGRLIPIGIGAFLVNVATGAMFFVSAPDQYLYNPAFQLKLACMAVAGLNLIAFAVLVARPLRIAAPDAPMPGAARAIALVSLASWMGVIGLGRLITFFRPPYHWCFWC